MSGSKDDTNARTNLETFSGEDASEYRRWRRKAEQYLMGLPTTVPESKWGARLVEHLRGEAEELMEHVELSTITDDKGYKKVFELLDERYKELDKDELQRCLKSYFYAAPIKNQETYRNFVIRMDTAYRGLTRHKVELPEPVRGWILLKKLLLDSTSEALIMTSTSGSLNYTDVLGALKAVFPNGQGPGVNPGKSKDKEIFIAQEDSETPNEATELEVPGNDDFLEVMEAVATQAQEQSDYESEDALEVFENYSSIRKKMQEKKTSRGFRQVNTTEKQWKLEGSVQGKLSLLKAKTRCHHCRRMGHWKKECPLRQNQGKKSEGGQKEVHIVESYSDDEAFFESYVLDEVKGKDYEQEYHGYQETDTKTKTETQKDQGAKRNRDTWVLDKEMGVLERIHQKERKGLFTPHGVKDLPIAMEEFSGERETIMINVATGEKSVIKDNYHTTRVPHQKMDYNWRGKTKLYLKTMDQSKKSSTSTKVVDPDAQLRLFEHEVLSAIHEGAQPVFSKSDQAATLDSHAVPDTACRRTLIGDYVLSLLESRLNEKGLIVTRRREVNEFRFGNAGILKSCEVASIPVTIGERHVVVNAAVLPEPGSRTPFLFSKELLKSLECILDTTTDEMVFKRINQRVKMGKTERGHYAIPILPREFIYKKPSAVQGEETASRKSECHVSHAGSANDTTGTRVDERAHRGRQDRHDPGRDRSLQRPRGRRANEASSWTGSDEGRQVQEHSQHGVCLHSGQEASEVGALQHPATGFKSRDEALPPLCGDERPEEESETLEPNGTAASSCSSTQDPCGSNDHSQGEGKVSGTTSELKTSRERGRRMVSRDDSDGDGLRRVQDMGISGRAREGKEPRAAESDVAGDRHTCGRAEPREGTEDDAGVRDHGHSHGMEDVQGSRGKIEPLEEVSRSVIEAGLDKIEREAQKCRCDVMIISQPSLSQHEVAEIFSVPRVSQAAAAVGLKCGPSYDILTGVDLRDKKERDRVREELRVRKPKLLVVCPPCGPFSPLQNLRKHWDTKEWLKQLYEGKIFLRYAAQLIQDQMDRGDIFVFEHPLRAKSWNDVCMQRLLKNDQVHRVAADQCMFGLKDRISKRRHRKSTCIMTNSKHVAQEMELKCSQDHEHEPIMGQVRIGGQWVSRSKLAQEYPQQFVKALLRGFLRDMHEREQSHVVHCVLTVEGLDENKQDDKRIAVLLKRCHENLGHPSTPRFIGMLKAARATEKCIQIAKGLRCTTCEQFQQQKSHIISPCFQSHPHLSFQ